MDEADNTSKSGQGPQSKRIFLVLTIAVAILGLLFAIPGTLFWLGPASEKAGLLISFAVIGALAGALLAGMIVGIWSLAHKYGKKAAIIGGATLVLIISVCIVIADFGFAGGFDPVYEVTFTVTGEGEAVVEYYIPKHGIANYEVLESVTLPWRITISTKKPETVRVFGEEGVKDLSCTIEQDGRHWLTCRGRGRTTNFCSYYP